MIPARCRSCQHASALCSLCAAAYLGISERSLRRNVEEGLPFVRLPHGGRQFLPEDLDAYQRAHRRRANPIVLALSTPVIDLAERRVKARRG